MVTRVKKSLGEYSSALLRIGVSCSTDAITTNAGLNKRLVFGTRSLTALAYFLAIHDVMKALMAAGPLLVIQRAHLLDLDSRHCGLLLAPSFPWVLVFATFAGQRDQFTWMPAVLVPVQFAYKLKGVYSR